MHRSLSILILIFCISCNNADASDQHVKIDQKEKKLIHMQSVQVKHTRHVRKKQHKICERLKKIRERLEKAKTDMKEINKQSSEILRLIGRIEGAMTK